MIPIAAFGIFRKRRVRRVANIVPQRKTVTGTTVGKHLGRRYFRHRFGNDFVRTLEIVVPQKRFVDRVGVEGLVIRIGDLRIERLGAAPGKSTENRIAGVVCQRTRGIHGVRTPRQSRQPSGQKDPHEFFRPIIQCVTPKTEGKTNILADLQKIVAHLPALSFGF